MNFVVTKFIHFLRTILQEFSGVNVLEGNSTLTLKNI